MPDEEVATVAEFQHARGPGNEPADRLTRQQFLRRAGMGLGAVALSAAGSARGNGVLDHPHVTPKIKRVIYLFNSGGPSQIELFDHKPELNRLHGTELPDSVRRGQRLTTMTGSQSSLPLAGSVFKFKPHGESGNRVSELLPHTSGIADEICIIRSMHTEAINHGPAVTYLQTGSQFPGRPSMGAWLDYGLGTENSDLPAFVVLVTRGKGGQPLLSRLWGSGFLPSKYQGVRFRSGKDPVLYLTNPDGLDAGARRLMLDRLRELHRADGRSGDSLLEARIAQYELAFRMQKSIPEATDFGQEPAHVFEEYGKDSKNPGTYAANCLLARRLAERGVRFIQLYHPGWDQHGNLPGAIRNQCRETDQATAALVKDLKRRGLLEDTLVIWGGEFGRTSYCQGKLTPTNYGRDHHPRCFSMWLAGGGIRGGTTYGRTDPFSYNIDENPVHIHDLQATILQLMGVDHERLSFKYQGRWFRLTDIQGKVIQKILA
ncbi:MAG: DUF1501 domain-containing protein [Planctomycetaceae bacterium]|jgi:hypothetical protein|nr:DUF1501 domain-containing protein [Planctomycetaceae bacterium]